LDVKAGVPQLTEELRFPGAVVVEAYVDDSFHIGRFLDTRPYENANVTTANKTEEIAHFEDDVLAASGLSFNFICAATFIVGGEEDNGVRDFRSVVFKFLNKSTAQVGFVAEDDRFTAGRGGDGVGN